MKVNDYINTTVYGHLIRVKVIAIHPFGTVDVQRADGQCFRLTGGAL
jgi:hypothetical protein